MKTVVLFIVCGVVAFLAMGYQMGIFQEAQAVDDEEAQSAVEKPAPPAPRARFPEDLAPACFNKPVTQAAVYQKSRKPHPLAFFQSSGRLHQNWQDLLDADWQADSVAGTELVVIVGTDIRTFLSIQRYPNGAPPVTRYKYELDVTVVAARTGKVLARNRFVSIPRAVRQLEDWRLTALGQPVSFTTVFNWVAAQARTGFAGYSPTTAGDAK